jgi:hypothetical protein
MRNNAEIVAGKFEIRCQRRVKGNTNKENEEIVAGVMIVK